MFVAESWLLWHFFTAQRSAVSQTLWDVLWHLVISCCVNVWVYLGGAPSCVCLATEAITAHDDVCWPELKMSTSLSSKCLMNICIDGFVGCRFLYHRYFVLTTSYICREIYNHIYMYVFILITMMVINKGDDSLFSFTQLRLFSTKLIMWMKWIWYHWTDWLYWWDVGPN